MKAEDNEFPYVTMVEQASDVATPAAGLWRIYPKSDGLYLIDDAGSVIGPLGVGGGGGSGGILAYKKYVPASQTSYTPTTTSYVDMDATNAAITFVTPASGAVLIQAQIGVAASLNNRTNINLREGTTNLSGTSRAAINTAWTGTSIQFTGNWSWIITGLTPGSSHTYKIGMVRFSGSTSTSFVADVAASDWGPLIITAAPLP